MLFLGLTLWGTAGKRKSEATLEQLDGLLGIVLATAEWILEFRQKNGSFKRIEHLMDVRGIRERKFLSLRGRVTVRGRASSSQPTPLLSWIEGNRGPDMTWRG